MSDCPSDYCEEPEWLDDMTTSKRKAEYSPPASPPPTARRALQHLSPDLCDAMFACTGCRVPTTYEDRLVSKHEVAYSVDAAMCPDACNHTQQGPMFTLRFDPHALKLSSYCMSLPCANSKPRTVELTGTALTAAKKWAEQEIKKESLEVERNWINTPALRWEELVLDEDVGMATLLKEIRGHDLVNW